MESLDLTSCEPRYLKKAQCIISQYGNYTIKDLDNMQLNGINTQVGTNKMCCNSNLSFREKTLQTMEA